MTITIPDNLLTALGAASVRNEPCASPAAAQALDEAHQMIMWLIEGDAAALPVLLNEARFRAPTP